MPAWPCQAMTGSTDSGQNVQHPLPENALYCSRIEIYHTLQTLMNERISLQAEIGDYRQFVSHILSVDPATGHFAVAYCANKALNSVLFNMPELEFTASYRGAHLAFHVSEPSDTQFDGQPAIQFAFPRSLILYHRREQPRIPVPADISLRCVADEKGVIPFEARITDVSLDGMGGILYDSGIMLAKGTVLKGCRIIMPTGEAVIADLEVRYTATTTFPDGTPGHRAGVRFRQRPEQIEALIDMFVRDLDKTTT